MITIISPSELQITLAKRVKDIRLMNNWTRQELAQRAGVNVNTLIKFERTGQISLARFLALCFTLGRLPEFESVLLPPEITSLKQLEMTGLRQRASRKRSKKHG